jgi:hypothetical protein
MNGFAIKTNVVIPGRHAMYVHRVPPTGLTVLTDVFPMVKTFKTKKSAEAFRMKHIDGPYMSDAVVVAAPSVAS